MAAVELRIMLGKAAVGVVFRRTPDGKAVGGAQELGKGSLLEVLLTLDADSGERDD